MKHIFILMLALPLMANTYVLDPIYLEAVPETGLTIKEELDSQVQLQETAPGLYNPIINGLQGDKISLTLDGLRFSNAIFRAGPNQYFSWIPQEFVVGYEIMPTSDAIGSTLNSNIGITESKAYYQFDQFDMGSTAVVKAKIDQTSVGVKFQKTQEYNDEPHTAYNQNALFLEQEILSHKAKVLYSESNDIDRPDKFLKGKIYTWEKQSYVLLEDQYQANEKNRFDLSYQRFYEKINDNGDVYTTIDNMYGLKYNNYFSDDLNLFISDYYEDIEHMKEYYDYNTLSTGFEYNYDVTDNLAWYLRYNFSYAYAKWSDVKRDFYNNAVSLQLDAYGVYARYDYGYKFPTLQNLAYAQTTGKGVDLPNEDLGQEKSDTFTLGYKGQFNGFVYDTSIYYVLIKDLIERELQNYQIDGEDVYQSINIDQGYMYGTNIFLSYKQEKFSSILTMEYVYGKTDIDYISKLTPFKLFYKMSYDNYYVRWKYAPKSHILSEQDKADVRIEDARYDQHNNNGYNTVDLGAEYIFYNKHSLHIDLNNIFNNNGRVLGSSVDVPERSISARYTYSF